jgi:hypothetical protein
MERGIFDFLGRNLEINEKDEDKEDLDRDGNPY